MYFYILFLFLFCLFYLDIKIESQTFSLQTRLMSYGLRKQLALCRLGPQWTSKLSHVLARNISPLSMSATISGEQGIVNALRTSGVLRNVIISGTGAIIRNHLPSVSFSWTIQFPNGGRGIVAPSICHSGLKRPKLIDSTFHTI